MKKIGLLLMPIMAISFLASCGKKSSTTITVTSIENCSLTYGSGTAVTVNTPITVNGGAITFTCTPSDDHYLDIDSFTFDDGFTGKKAFNDNKLVITGITKNCKFSAKAYAQIEYFIDFESNGGTSIPTQRVKEGKTVTKPSDPKRDEYIFGGWYSDSTFKTPYSFKEEVVSDTTLYAKWNDAYHFKFSGTNCLINGTNSYETDIPMGATNVKFQIAPAAGGYSLPIADDFHVITGSSSGVTYNNKDGVVTINKMIGEVVITATSQRLVNTNWQFKFTGTNCTMNNLKIYRTFVPKDEDGVKFTILPDNGYKMPVKADISVTGKTGTVGWDYADGVLTITKMITDISVTAVAQEGGSTYYSVSFQCDDCKAGTTVTETDAKYTLITTMSSDANFVLHLFPDSGFELPNNINVTFSSGAASASDYVYDKDQKTIKIIKKDHVLISLAKAEHLVTLDAGAGTFFGGSNKFTIGVEDGMNVSLLLHILNVQPTLKDKLFAFYRMQAGTSTVAVRYDSVITSDLTLTAYYFDTNEPYDDLDSINWDYIKQVAITNSNPAVCFNLGATKTVTINGQDHQTRIIGFNHDKIVNSTESSELHAGFTFEFANLISNHEGNYISQVWNNEKGGESDNHDYPNATLNNYLNDELIDSFPSDLVEHMATVDKNVGVYDNDANTYKSTPYETKLFPLACAEMFKDLTGYYVAEGEGNIYEYYKDGTKGYGKTDVKGNDYSYWLRSPQTETDSLAYCNGTAFTPTVDSPYAVAPAFCI